MPTCDYSDPTDCRECPHRDHMPACRCGIAGGQGRSAAEIRSIGESLWRALGVLVVLAIAAIAAWVI